MFTTLKIAYTAWKSHMDIMWGLRTGKYQIVTVDGVNHIFHVR